MQTPTRGRACRFHKFSPFLFGQIGQALLTRGMEYAIILAIEETGDAKGTCRAAVATSNFIP